MKVKGWSAEEMKDKPSSPLEEETGEMMEWRSMSQEETDQCRKKLAEKMEEEVWTRTRSRTANERLAEAEAPFWNGGVYEEAGCTEHESGEKIVGQ